eukprot:113090-Chlamydomonas_euryale.AAC.1
MLRLDASSGKVSNNESSRGGGGETNSVPTPGVDAPLTPPLTPPHACSFKSAPHTTGHPPRHQACSRRHTKRALRVCSHMYARARVGLCACRVKGRSVDPGW